MENYLSVVVICPVLTIPMSAVLIQTASMCKSGLRHENHDNC